MGFYSFYRIFKDIIKSIFGNKSWRITLIICLVFLVIIFFNNKVNASDLRPWNVYNNTTEFNWSRLTHLNFVTYPSNLPYKLFEIKPDETYYLYNPNSSTGSIHYFCYSSNDVNRPLLLIQDPAYQSALHFEYNYEMEKGYIDVPYNIPFTPSMTYYVFINDDCEIYLFDDKYSNIETYNELSALAVDLHNFLFGDDSSSVNTNLATGLVASGSGSFLTYANNNVYYFPVKKGYTYSFSFDYNNPYSERIKEHLRFGYTSSVPSNGVSYTNMNFWDTINFSYNYEFTATTDSYFYISYVSYLFSNFVFSSNYNPDQSGGINQQIINQAQQTRETLTDSNISQDSSDYSLPTDSTSDITASGFASIFDRIKNTFTSPVSTPIVITVPFTGKSFTISKQSVYGSANLGIVQTLIECFWWYIIALFVCKDVFKKIEKLKTGNIEFTETTNIKEDIL